MDSMTIFAIAGCLMSAAIVFVVLKVHHFGETQVISDKILQAQNETSSVKKKLLGYTRYGEYLDVGKQALINQLKPPVAKVVREYVHVANMDKDRFKLKADVTVIVKYSVEFSFSLDWNASGLDVIHAANGVGLKISRPVLMGEPAIKTLSHQTLSASAVEDDRPLLVDIHANFVELAKRYGIAVSSEESLRAMCKLKALECFRDALAKQSGVQHLPGIFVEFV